MKEFAKGATPAPEVKTANMEATTNTDFLNYPAGGNRSSLNLFDYTDAGTTFTYSNKLTGGYNSQIGVARSYKVYAGDKVKIEAWAPRPCRCSSFRLVEAPRLCWCSSPTNVMSEGVKANWL